MSGQNAAIGGGGFHHIAMRAHDFDATVNHLGMRNLDTDYTVISSLLGFLLQLHKRRVYFSALMEGVPSEDAWKVAGLTVMDVRQEK